MGHPAYANLRSALSGNEAMPIAWRNSLGVLLGMVLGGGFGLLLDQAIGGGTVLISFLTGMFLGLISATGPFFMSLRIILGAGVLMMATSALAVVAVGNAWVAVIGMVLLTFVATVWTAIPMVGGLLGAFPTILFLLILAKGETFTGGSSAGRVALGAAAGLVAALVVLVIMSGWDPRKITRRMTAGAWSPGVSWSQLGSILSILRFDGAPASLIAVAQSGILAMISRNWLEQDKDTETYKAGLQAQGSIAGALLPRGAVVPRTVTPPVVDACEAMKSAGKAAGERDDRKTLASWDRWESSLGYAADVLAGTAAPQKITLSSLSMTSIIVGSVLHPDSASLRYGVQRAVALGAATFVMIRWDVPDFYWVLLTLFSVMQTNAVATLSRSVQYAFGTWVGAVGAVILSLVLPPALLSLIAIILLVAGFAWLTRNYTVMAVAVAAAVVLITGAPDGEYLQWAGLRALDVTAGVVVALMVSSFILRVRPQPALHVQRARDALLAAVKQLRGRLRSPGETTSYTLADEGTYLRATANLQADMQLMKDSTAEAQELQQLEDANDHMLALASVIFAGEAGRSDFDNPDARALMGKGLDALDRRIRDIGATPAPTS